VKDPDRQAYLAKLEIFTRREWCELIRCSDSMFFKMQREGWGPDRLKVGANILITREAHLKWLREREAAAAGVRRGLPQAPEVVIDGHQRISRVREFFAQVQSPLQPSTLQESLIRALADRLCQRGRMTGDEIRALLL